MENQIKPTSLADFTSRPYSEDLESLLNYKFPVLDHGYVVLRDYMGTDESIEAAARQSYVADTEGDEIRTPEQRRTLLRYLMRHNHSSPFEMAEIVFQVKAPIFIFRQWHRHRTASINELSGRYTELTEEFYCPERFSKQSKSNKQGAETAPLTDSDIFQELLASGAKNDMEESFDYYHKLLENGVAKEQARGILPLNTYSVMTWKCNARNLLHFLKLRLHPHAQAEFQEYAEVIANIVKVWLPITWEAFIDYQLDAVTFSRREMNIIEAAWKVDLKADFTQLFESLTVRERKEFNEKLNIK